MMKISAVVLAKNEEKNIADCIDSVSWCDEILVIDDNSKDKTAEIAKRSGAKVFVHPLNNDFSGARNFGLSKTTGDWVLFIDADERVTTSLSENIKDQISKIKDPKTTGFYIKRKDILWGKELKHGEVRQMKLLRLAKKNSGKWEESVHEKWIAKGKIGELKNPLIHYPHQNISDFLKEINFYTDLRAKELFNRGIKTNWLEIIFYPKVKFFLNYVFKMGFLDGLEGLIFAILMSFHSFLVKGKLWQLWQKK